MRDREKRIHCTLIHLPTKKCLLPDNRKTTRRNLIIRLITFLLGLINSAKIRKLAIFRGFPYNDFFVYSIKGRSHTLSYDFTTTTTTTIIIFILLI